MGAVGAAGRRPARARRFAVVLPIRYRCSSDEPWQSGTTQNLSCSGVLFRAQRPLAPHTPVLLQFRLPSELTGEKPVEVACEARTVRASNGHGPCAVAATLMDCRPAGQEREPVGRPQPPLDERTLEMWHRVNNQMTLVVGAADLLLAAPGRGDAAARLEEIKRAGLTAAAIVYEFVRGSQQAADADFPRPKD